MLRLIASRIMPRTTINIDPTVLQELKRRQRRDGKPLGELVSELVADALDRDSTEPETPFRWVARPMRAMVDLDDTEAVRRALEER